VLRRLDVVQSLDKHSAYELGYEDAALAALVAGIERTPSLVMMFLEGVWVSCLDILSRGGPRRARQPQVVLGQAAVMKSRSREVPIVVSK
jgi:hypothetical protein